MAKQEIFIGTTANDGTGDQLRDAFDKTNDNVNEIYGGLASIARQSAPPTLIGEALDIAGMLALDAGSLYVCTADYNGATPIWFQIDDVSNDAHASDGTIHFTEASINVTESQISDLQAYALDSETVKSIAVPATAKGSSGDTVGMLAIEAGFIYTCHTTWIDGVADIWDRVATATWV